MRARKMSAISALAGGFAHDFNNMLAAISGFTELALEDIPPESPARENLLETMAGVKKARGLVDQIHAIGSRARRGFRPVSLSALLETSLTRLRTALPSTIHIQTDFPGDPAAEENRYLSGNPDDLALVVDHLIQNATEALLPAGGKITLHLGYSKEGNIELSITDNGPGMTSAILERLFEPFFTTRPKSRGLGLAICHGIVEKHRGTIAVTSRPGHGTCVTMQFPMETGPQKSI